MLTWYVKHAPIKRKMTIAFGLMSATLGTAAAFAAFESHRMDLAARGTDVRAMKAALEGGSDTTFLFCLGAFVVSLVLGYVLNKVITTPYVTTVVRMEKLAAGDLDTPIQFTDFRDCVGRMTRAMQTFKEAVASRARAEAEAAEQRGLTEAERTRNERARATQEEQQRFVVESLASGLAALSAGNLRARLNEAFPPEYRQLQEDFNAAVDTLQQTMSEVVANAGAITTGTGEISQAADDLSRRTEQQAATLEETAAALDEITATVRKTATGASQANTVVGAAKGDAEKSGQIVGEAVAAMSQIEQSSQQISQIIGVIDEIAFQTNLLALNAGVEAARAGDAGKGFAVVASEVRALAQRSAEAAKEIKALISASSQQVQSGVGLVGQTGEALQRIVVRVDEISGLVAEITASAQEQATALSEVNTAVNQMDQVTQQNAAMVEQSTAASHSLAQEAAELSRLIQKFEIGESGHPVHAAQARVAAFGNKQAAAPARRPAVRHATAGSTALAVSQDGWEEF